MREPHLTDRLILRDITEADAELLFELDGDPLRAVTVISRYNRIGSS
jgi:RimJ/RimL family protein N-acetyltransferase